MAIQAKHTKVQSYEKKVYSDFFRNFALSISDYDN